MLVGEFYEIDRHEFDRSTVLRGLGPLLDGDEHGQVWLLLDNRDRSAAGYAVMTWSWSLESGGREALLDEIYVRDRASGAGSALLNRVLREASARGARAVFLETEEHNERVRAFYSRHGFAVEKSTWMSRVLP
ncbi:GNAT superfamily N-acetyltransferase [Kutzneria viridogrisea]|uniref:N-acetyltransferase domain-containing protein n=2 Tax=Kutzneria TaxID=43356 RepID=W5WFP4_9PSEU|nr:GNAT family N-acetyltransferase [Kutzneria albida]AHH99575.1 hypothetical protein KALB_6215 [Kutzneria albida DSM 43870]MBA8922870.1 GNAT superfamily N-acetyltransferase [Kutzneria viridogrisea]